MFQRLMRLLAEASQTRAIDRCCRPETKAANDGILRSRAGPTQRSCTSD